MAKPRRSRRAFTLVVLVLVSITLITVDETSGTHHLTSGVKSVATDVFSPLRSAANDVFQPIGDFFAGSANYGSLQQQNQQLEQTVGRLRLRLAERGYSQSELRQLLALRDLPFIASLPTVTAETTSLDTSNFASTVDIDKGRDDGVAYGMPVVGAGGLVGQVVQANHHSAIVQLVTDGQSQVGVAFGDHDQHYATIDGQGAGRSMSAEFVAPGTPLHRGEQMDTNSLNGGDYPPGIPVGVVRSVHTAVDADQQTVAVTPMANLSQLAFVDVVLWEPAP